MLAKKINEDTWIIRLIKGEELLTELNSFCRAEHIQLGYFTGLGAVQEVELGLFHHDTSQYQMKLFKGSLEIIALHGNITTLGKEIYLHTHIGISDEGMRMFGGHLFRATIDPTAEVILHRYDGTVSRAKDEGSGLNFLSL